MNWALIKNNEVKNVIKAEPNFIARIQSNWDLIIQIDGISPRPSKGWNYENDTFIAPPEPPPVPESPEEIARKEAIARLGAAKDNIPIQGVALQNILKDIIEVLF